MALLTYRPPVNYDEQLGICAEESSTCANDTDKTQLHSRTSSDHSSHLQQKLPMRWTTYESMGMPQVMSTT